MTTSEVSVVTAWHEALNSGDVERLVALSHPDIEVGGPHGTGRGTQLLREWVGRAGIRLDHRRIFQQADTVVVEQEAEWRSADTGNVTGNQTLTSIFVVRDDRVVSVLRYPGLAEALHAAELDESHETGSDWPLEKHENPPPALSSYEAAGVSIERGDRATEMMRSAVQATHGSRVVSYPNGFAGLYALSSSYADPVLASSIDGVGTKALVAKALGRYASIGEDIVNHCANDVLATGARPLLFLDYVASGKLEPENAAGIVRGAAEACGALDIALIGGETAEMPGLYGEGDFDVVGTCLGACERAEVVTGKGVEVGDAVIGLASSGLHTNGYTLARKVLEDAGLSYSETPEGFGRTIGEESLVPHRAYVREILALRESVEVRGMAHITGGGIPGNLPRALGGLGARLDASSWEEPPVFGFIRSVGGVSEEEMRRVFNLGVGFCVVVRDSEAEEALAALGEAGCEARRIGEVVAEPAGGVEFVS